MTTKLKIFTIGVYGTQEDSFFEALTNHHIDTFCDIRLRRGMRGAKYAYVNSKYLQAKLASLGIRYRHFKELAPTKAIREAQKQADKDKKVKKSDRQTLSSEFIQAYENEILADFKATDWVNQLDDDAARIVLFCVEQEPAACHRSLLAERLAQDLNVEVSHIIP